MSYRQVPSKFKNQILTAQKRDRFHSELDLTRDAIGNDGVRTVQANHETLVFSCGSGGVGFVPLQQPGKFGFQHPKVSCGHVSDIHITPFVYDRLVAVSCTDQSIRIFKVPNVEKEEEIGSPEYEFRASAGAANTPVLVCWNPQVSGILAVGSGNKVDVYSTSTNKIELTIDISSPAISLDWSHDGAYINVISKDTTLRIIDPRNSDILHQAKLPGSKHVLKSLPDRHWVVSSLSRMRERELNLYSIAEPSKSIKSWNFGTASTPLIPIPDTVRKVVYLLDKSGGVLRWVETFAPYNEGAAGTSVDQSSSGCLIHPFGLQLMEGEINRVVIADTKGNTVPVRITIGRKSYLEFHEDIFTPIEVESTISADSWLSGTDGMAKMAKVNPSLVNAALAGKSLTENTITTSASVLNATTKRSKEPQETTIAKEADPVDIKPESTTKSANISTTKSQVNSNASSTLSAREQRKWDKEEAASRSDSPREVYREDLSSRRAEYGASSPRKSEAVQPTAEPKAEDELALTAEPAMNAGEKVEQKSEATEDVKIPSIGKGVPPTLDDEDALEQLRARRVTPAVEQSEQQRAVQIESPQPKREVYREDLSARRAEYGASPSSSKREVFKENLGERRSEYGATSSPSKVQASKFSSSRSSTAEQEATKKPDPVDEPRPDNNGREVYREDLSARRAEYGAPSKLGTSSIVNSSPSQGLSAREQRKWDKAEAKHGLDESRTQSRDSNKNANSPGPAKMAGSDITSGTSSPAKPSVQLQTEREVFKEDLTSRRAEYGATPKLDGPTQAYKDISKALGNAEPQGRPKASEEVTPYKLDDDLAIKHSSSADTSTIELEDVYAPPIEDSKINVKKVDLPIEEPSAIEDKVKVPSSEKAPLSPAHASPTPIHKAATAPMETTAFGRSKNHGSREYTRKYLQGKMQHTRNSYTSLVGLNASLPNTARMIDATPAHIIVPLAGPGGRLGIIPYEKSGRLPPLLYGFMGGAQVVDFELDKFTKGRVVSAHIDQAVRVWKIPDNLDDVEGDVEQPERVLRGMDRILAISLHPLTKDLLLVTTSTKLHLFNIETGEELKTYAAKGVANTCWSPDGTKIGVGKSDKSISIIDARSGEELNAFPSAHQSTRPFRILFVEDDRLITAGFGRGSIRQLVLYDLNTGRDLQVHDMDISPSPFSLPYFDEMTSILYLIPRGTSAVLPFHIQSDSFTPLSSYTAADPIMGTAFLSPQDLNTADVEVARCLRLTTNEVSVVGFHIPRPSGDFFHNDIYPTHVRDRYTPSLSIEDWLAGKRSEQPSMVDLNPKGFKHSSEAGVGSVSKKSGSSVAAKAAPASREAQPKKQSELEQMFEQAKGQNGDDPDYQNNAANTRWD